MKSTQRSRGMPSITSNDALGSIYSLKQPGYNQHPALRQRQSQRGSIHQSTSLMFPRADREPGHRPLAEPPMKSGGARPLSLQRGGDQYLLSEVPYRLESCRKRLAAADMELEKCWSVPDIVSQRPASREHFEVGHQAPMSLANPSMVPPHVAPGGLGGEPLQASGMFDKTDSDEEADMFGGNMKDLQKQLVLVEGQLVELEKRFRTTETERQHLKREQASSRVRCEDLVRQLKDADEQVRTLSQDNVDLEDRGSYLSTELGAYESTAETLRTNLGVSEAQAHQFREELDTLGDKHRVATQRIEFLSAQANTLSAQLYTSQGSLDTATTRIDMAKQQRLADHERIGQAEETQAASDVEHEKLVAELQEAAIQLEELDRLGVQHLDATQRIEILSAQVDALSAQLCTSEETVESITAKLERADEQHLVNQDRIEQADKKQVASDLEREELMVQLKQAAVDMEDAVQRVKTESKEALAAQAEEAERFHSKNTVDALNSLRAQFEDELSAEKTAHVSTKAGRDTAEAEAGTATLAVAEHKKEIEAMEARLAAQGQELEAQRQEAASAQDLAQKSADRLDGLTEFQEQQADDTLRQLAELHNALDRQKAETAQAQEAAAAARGDADKASEDAEAARAEAAKACEQAAASAQDAQQAVAAKALADAAAEQAREQAAAAEEKARLAEQAQAAAPPPVDVVEGAAAAPVVDAGVHAPSRPATGAQEGFLRPPTAVEASRPPTAASRPLTAAGTPTGEILVLRPSTAELSRPHTAAAEAAADTWPPKAPTEETSRPPTGTGAAEDAEWPPKAPTEAASRPPTALADAEAEASAAPVPRAQSGPMLTPPRTAATEVHLDDTSDKLGALAAASVGSALVQAAADTKSEEAQGEMGLISSLAAVPELIQVADLESCPEDADECLKFTPAHCQVDVGTKQLRLVLLGPVAPPQKIPLQGICSISQPSGDGFSPYIDIEISPGEPKPQFPGPTRRIRLASADELCASALMAALNAPHRNMPGSSLATPQSSACGGMNTPRPMAG